MDDTLMQTAAIESGVLARILTQAVNASGRPRRDIARASGLHKDSFLRALRGTRDVTTDEAVRILKASGASPKATLVLALTGGEDMALAWMHSEMGAFFEELLVLLPGALASELGDNLSEIKPKWATGTAKLVARLLAEHVTETARRDAVLGEQRAIN